MKTNKYMYFSIEIRKDIFMYSVMVVFALWQLVLMALDFSSSSGTGGLPQMQESADLDVEQHTAMVYL